MNKKSNAWLKTMITKHGSLEAVREIQREIGRRGGKRSTGGGFASEVIGADGLSGRERARVVGAIGGRNSRRGEKRVGTYVKEETSS